MKASFSIKVSFILKRLDLELIMKLYSLDNGGILGATFKRDLFYLEH